jgi:hypothetical protein
VARSSEELAAAGALTTGENAPPHTDDPATEAIHDSDSREDREIRFENRSIDDEDISNVEVDLSELVAARAKSYPPAFVFGKSKVTAEIIEEYERAGFFPAGDGRPPSGEEVPAPEANEVIVFRDSLPVDLDFLAILSCLPFLRSFL